MEAYLTKDAPSILFYIVNMFLRFIPLFQKRHHNYFSKIFLNWKYAILNSTIFGLARLALDLVVSYLLLTAMNVFHINVSKRNNEIFGVTIQSNSWLKEVIFKKLANNLNIKHDIFNAEIILSYKINNNYF